MKYRKIQFILLFVTSALCWNNVFGYTTDNSFCNSYLIQTNQLDVNLVEFSIYNSTDFGPYYPDLEKWYILELEFPLGDSVSVALDPDQILSGLSSTLCVDYEVDGNACTQCVTLPSTTISCNYKIALESYGLELSGSIYSPNGSNYVLPSDITWVLEDGGGVIGTGSNLNYTFDEEGTYFICAEYEDALMECTGVLCDSIVMGNTYQPCDYYIHITQTDSTTITGMVYSGSNTPPPPSDVTWTLGNDDDIIGNQVFITHQFSEPGEYTICVEFFDEFTGCETFLCKDIITTNGSGANCQDIDFEYEIQEDWATFQVYGPDVYEIFEDSIGWYVDGVFLEYGNPIEYNFSPSAGQFTVCAEVIADPSTGEICVTEICYQIGGNCPPLSIFSGTVNDSTVAFQLFTSLNPYLFEDIFWHVDGNIVGQDDALTYVFPESGSYLTCASATATDAQGNWICDIESCIDIEVEMGQQNEECEAFFMWSIHPNLGEVVQDVDFFDLSIGNYAQAQWNINGNIFTTSPGDVFDYSFENLGTYNVCLTVWNDDIGCEDTHCELILISGILPTSDCGYEIIYDTSVENVFDFTLFGAGMTPVEVEWYNGQTGEAYGTGNISISIPLLDYGINEICAVYAPPAGSICSGFICTTIVVENPECENTDCVFPGDADRNMIVDNYDVLPLGLHFGETGVLRSNATIDWYGQPAIDWQNITEDSLNLKHLDCNGNGEIFFDDVYAIEQNYNRTHNGVTANRVDNAPGLYLEFDLDTIYSTPDTGNITINADIIMGTLNLPVEEVYGVAFSIGYPADLVNSGSVMADYFMDSWIGNPTTTLQLEKNVVNQSVVDFAYSRTDQQNISGFGQIGSVSFVMTDNIIGKLSSIIELNFPITNVRAVLNTGEEVIIMGSENAVTVNINDTATDTNTLDLSQHINIFPNPTSNTINITTNDLQAQTLTLYNTVGQQVLARQVISTNTQIDVSQLPSGMYLLSIQTDKGLHNEKIIVE